jgi:hypothetical protein
VRACSANGSSLQAATPYEGGLFFLSIQFKYALYVLEEEPPMTFHSAACAAVSLLTDRHLPAIVNCCFGAAQTIHAT